MLHACSTYRAWACLPSSIAGVRCRTLPFKSSFTQPLRKSRTNLRAAASSASAQQVDINTLESAAKEIDERLSTDGPRAETDALQLMSQLRDDGLVRVYGQAAQVPKRVYSLEELRLNNIEPEKYLSPTDNTLNFVRTVLQGTGLAAIAAAYFVLHLEMPQLLAIAVGTLFVLTADQVANGGGLEALAVDTAGRVISSSYGKRVAFHESGHFLIAYLLGLLPRTYTLSSLDAYRKYGALNVQAGTQFCDSAFQKEVASGTLSSSSLDVYTCVALAGVATEYLTFGAAEGGLADVQQLDALLRALQFTQKKADSQIRWAVLNTTTLLRRHASTHARLADAMNQGASVGECIRLIERLLATSDDI